ncbi:MAG: Hsp20/alpha crystallin family protein [Saprospiraceae bacterium]|nr:Hsp20/alpha crystallin family protein [Saprospiraceae bacterium]
MSTLAKWVAPDLTNGSSLMPNFSSVVENFFGRDFNSLFDTAMARHSRSGCQYFTKPRGLQRRSSGAGMKRDDFKVEVENDVLIISAEKKEEKEEKDKRYTRREYSYNAFSRSFILPEGVKLEDVKANYKDGVLHISVPKTEVENKKASAKQIAIS